MSINKADEKWKKDFKDKLGDYRHPVRNGMWEDIANSLPQHKKRSRRSLWAWIGSTAAMLTTIIVLAGPHIVNYVIDLSLFDVKTEKTETKDTKPRRGHYGKRIQEVYANETENEEIIEDSNIDENISTDTESIYDKRGAEEPKKQEYTYSRKKRKDVKTNDTKVEKEEKADDDMIESNEELIIDSLNVSADTISINVLQADTLAISKDIKTDEIEETEDDTEQPKIKKDYSSWSFAISSKNMIYNGYRKQWGGENPNMATDIDYVTGGKKQFDHPININLTVRKQLNNRWAMEGGVSYTYLRSKEIVINNLSTATVANNIKIHNLGIPISVEYMLYRSDKINIYSKYGIMVEKTKKSEKGIKDWQVSTWLSGGVSYRLGKNIGVFIEPGGTYYFDNKTTVPTLRNEVPLNFDITAGLRFYPFTH